MSGAEEENKSNKPTGRDNDEKTGNEDGSLETL